MNIQMDSMAFDLYSGAHGGFMFNSLLYLIWLFIKVIYIFTVFLIKCNSVFNQIQMFTMKQNMIYTLYLIAIWTFITLNMFIPKTPTYQYNVKKVLYIRY